MKIKSKFNGAILHAGYDSSICGTIGHAAFHENIYNSEDFLYRKIQLIPIIIQG